MLTSSSQYCRNNQTIQ